MPLDQKQSGQTLVEILVAVFIMGLLSIALFGVAVVSTKTALVSEQRTVAQAIANEKIELIKVTPYIDVGLDDGSTPDGVYAPTETITQNDQEYVISIAVELIDDDKNGCVIGVPPCNNAGLLEADADYKKVVVSVKYPAADTVTKEVKISVLSVSGQAESLITMVECDAADVTGSCGIGQLCCSQMCIPVCEPGTCPEGYQCASDGCGCEINATSWENAAECFNDFECMTLEQQCVEGSCEDPCNTNADCPAQEECLYNACESTCSTNSECSKDKECVEGVCQLLPCLDDSYCQRGYMCESFQCTPSRCGSDDDCSADHQCVDNTCMPDPCSDNECTGDWMCVSGSCQPPYCNVNRDCVNGNSCVQGQCQPLFCANHEQCQGDAVCLAGVCSDPPPCPCPATLQCSVGVCVNPNRDIVPLSVSAECPAPFSLPCMPAIGEVTTTWMPVDGQEYCTPVITSTECTTALDPLDGWSDTDGDGVTNCSKPSDPILNECAPFYPIECGTSLGGVNCPVGESCLEGRCFPDAPCPAFYAPHPTVAGACVKEWGLNPPIVCPAVCPGAAYCSNGECVTVGCQTDDQCSSYGDYMCRNLICVPKKERDCSYCIPPERIQYCYGLDCADCGGGAGSPCTDSLGLPSVVAWYEDKATGCSSLTCPYASPVCGDGVIQPGEECDTAACLSGAACSIDCECPAEVCGNNITEAFEECDGTDDAACPGNCGGGGAGACLCAMTEPDMMCGNGLVETEAGEDCDPYAVPDGCSGLDYCELDCWCYPYAGAGEPPPATCGDGTIDPGEMCDDTAGPTGCAAGDTCEFCECYGESPAV
jgi:type II secretory pathway pseudopilin PulG